MRIPPQIWLTPNAGRLYSDVVSLFTMSLDPKIKTSNWTAKQQMLLNGQIELIFFVTSHPEGMWWVEEDLNLRPHAYQACALTT